MNGTIEEEFLIDDEQGVATASTGALDEYIAGVLQDEMLSTASETEGTGIRANSLEVNFSQENVREIIQI